MPHSSRRSFLKASALAGAATALSPLSALARNEEPQAAAREKGLVILFQGDSITDGNRGRNNDPNHIMGHGYAFAVASRVGADFPHMGLSFVNRGISGNKVPDLQERWQVDTLDIKPDVLSLLVGINDTAAAMEKPHEAPDAAAFEKGYRQLLQACRSANPDMLFALGIPFVYPVGQRKENFALWQAETDKRAAAVRQLAKEFGAVTVDYPAAFNKVMQNTAADYWIWDGIHPTVYGHEIMAREWIRQVSARLKFLRNYAY